MSHSPRFSVSSPYSWSFSLCFRFFMFFSVSHHLSRPTVCVFHFPWFSVFSPYSRSYSVQFSFFKFLSFLALFQVLRYAFLIFHIFQCFSRNFMSYSVCFSFSMTSVFLPCFRSYSENLLFSTFSSVSRHIPCQTVFVSYFLTFFSFLIKIQALHYIFVNFHVFDCFLTYSRSYNVCVSFKTFLVFCS